MKAYSQMNRYLSSFVEHAIRDNDYGTRDKLFLEKLLRNELQPPLDKSKVFFVLFDVCHSKLKIFDFFENLS